MIRRFCDLCEREITPYASPHFKSGAGDISIYVNSENVRNHLGWPIEPCLNCITQILSTGKWEFPKESVTISDDGR